jgi:Cysteine-rich CWC
MTTPAGAEDRCPRCGAGFHCGANDPTPCACRGLTLDAALLVRLRDRYRGCLCLRCLAELQAEARDRTSSQGPAGSGADSSPSSAPPGPPRSITG